MSFLRLIASGWHQLACWLFACIMFIGGLFSKGSGDEYYVYFICGTILMAAASIVDAIHSSREHGKDEP